MTMSNLARHKFSVPLDREQVAQDWKQRGYSCDLFTDPPGREWHDFVHTTNELVTVVVGKLRLTIGDEKSLPSQATRSLSRKTSATP
ncbi:MAG: hypothetical protein HC938_16655 [Nitrospira sp.]|nr:hypothetical protein [Nitrospira sp.]